MAEGSVHGGLLEEWLRKLEENFDRYMVEGDHSEEEKLEFIRRQYLLLDTVIKVLDGNATLIGCLQPQQKRELL